MKQWSRRGLALLFVWMLVGCGGAGEAPAAGDPDNRPSAGDDGNDDPAELRSCQASFDPERAAAGEDCAPEYGAYCEDTGGSGSSFRNVAPCEGVLVSESGIQSGRIDSSYYVLRAADAAPEAIYLGLHWFDSNAERFINLLRMQELAKARPVLIVVPNAPSNSGLGLAQRWPPAGASAEDIAEAVALLDGIVAAVRRDYGLSQAPLFVSGLSNGGIMAAHYLCERPGQVAGVQMVAATVDIEELGRCRFTQAVGTVQVHGTSDPVIEYGGTATEASVDEVYRRFIGLNDCGAERSYVPLSGDPPAVDIHGATDCRAQRRDYLVVVNEGGHTWPGMSANSAGLYGDTATSFDATIQGYDLLMLASGG